MENDKEEGDKEYTREPGHNQASLSDDQIDTAVNKPDFADNQHNSVMKEGYRLSEGDRSVRVTMDQRTREDSSPCNDMSLDNSKEDSDFSDYSEDNNRCQLANQALRAKLLNGVFNPITGNDSKLRVSVFDHRIIPKKLIIARKNDNHTGVDTRDNLNENKLKSQRGANVNEPDNTNKRKGQSLSYAVLKASRKSSTGSPHDDKSENNKMESDNEYRTRFDILLRNLIGDVSDMQVEPSPMTVSSGYESDYIQTREADIDKMFNTNKTSVSDNKENIPQTHNVTDTSNGYLTMPGKTATDFPPSSPLTDNHQFTSLPSIPTQQAEKPKVRSFEETETSKQNKADTDSNKFNYAQRHNYKLTKVTRSMYEIIHDLQNGDKPGPDGRKRSRKGRKCSQDGLPGSDGNSSAKESRSGLIRIPSDNDNTHGNRNNDANGSSVSGAVVRCVRRPMINDSSSFRPAQRKSSHSDSQRLASSSSNNDCDKVQNDLRNLLCDTGDVKSPSADNNERVGDFNTLSSGWTQRDRQSDLINGPTNFHLIERGITLSNGQRETALNQAEESITPTGLESRRPTLTQQFLHRSRPEDHVYETIPGDEKLYEEWKKMRENPKIPKIRRFTTVPDLPGTFIPKEPPALPARKYLSNTNTNTNSNNTHAQRHSSKDHDDYIFMGDINSNFPSTKPDQPPPPPSSSSSRFEPIFAPPTTTRPGAKLEPNLFQCYPYTLHDENVFNQPSRNDETSDGYCSIDNLSLLRENVGESPTLVPTPGVPSERDWRPIATNSLPRAPLKRSDFFLHPQDTKRNGFNLSTSHLFPDRPPPVSDRRNISLARANGGGESEVAPLLPPSFDQGDGGGKPVFQATYV